jgi:hypothetical protein
MIAKLTIVCSSRHKTFAKKVCSKRKTEITTIRDSLKKIAEDEVARVQSIWKEHVEFFDEPESSAVPVTVSTFFEEPSSGDRR